jgi:hypothetical protein
VLRTGPASPYARWFDVEWAAHERALLMPVLGRRIGEVVADGEIVLDRDTEDLGGPVLRYFDHVFPVRPGTEDLPLPELLDRQFYRLAHWRVGDEELNYRRFFDIDTLAGVRVEDEQVFAETHAVLLALVAEGRIQGLRIDHPDGLADPRGYVQRLFGSTGAWIVVEKILEGDEQLPADWPCAGTTGYDALLRIGGVLVDDRSASALTNLYTGLTGSPPTSTRWSRRPSGSWSSTACRPRWPVWSRWPPPSATTTSSCGTTPGAASARRWSSCSSRCRSIARTSCPASPRRPRVARSSARPRPWPASGWPRTGWAPSTCWSSWPWATRVAGRTGTSSWSGSSRPAAR